MFGIPRLLRRLSSKRYDPGAWERDLSVDELQHCYDLQGWETPAGEWRQRSVDRLAARLREVYEQKREAATMLDVACFSGEYFGRLMSQLDMETVLRYTGIDITPKFVARAAERWGRFANAEFKVGSALQLEFPADSFDVVLNSGMLIHVADPAQCIREFARVARRFLLVETTVQPSLQVDFRDENKSGDEFIDRVYRPAFIENLLESVAVIQKKSEVPYQKHVSALYECVPR